MSELQVFPWCQPTESVHRLLAHSAELMGAKGGYGLGRRSEAAGEAVHKNLRRDRNQFSRRTSHRDCLVDLFGNQWVRADFRVREEAEDQVKKCSFCQETGHTKKSCPSKPSDDSKRQRVDATQDLVKSFLLD